MKILVTGCAGFIGSHLCERLIEQGDEVIGIDNFDAFYPKQIKWNNLSKLLENSRFSFHQVDIRKEEQLAIIGESFDIVVHLAAKAGVRPSIEQPEQYIETNITGTQNILNLMRNKGANKIVFASSSSVYGDKTPAPYPENAIVDFPISPYAFTKKSGELLLHTYYHLYKINTIALRFFTVYGPRQRPDLAINKFFSAIENNQPIHVFGDGSTSRDYTFIDDIINGITSAITLIKNNNNIYEIINLGNNKPTKLLDLIAKIEQVAGKKATLIFKDMQPGDVVMTCADTAKANQLLGYLPQTTMEEGLQRYYQWRESLKTATL